MVVAMGDGTLAGSRHTSVTPMAIRTKAIKPRRAGTKRLAPPPPSGCVPRDVPMPLDDAVEVSAVVSAEVCTAPGGCGGEAEGVGEGSGGLGDGGGGEGSGGHGDGGGGGGGSGSGDGGGGVGGTGGGGGGSGGRLMSGGKGGNMKRGPQSAQSVPKAHSALTEPVPPSWHVPLWALPRSPWQVFLHHMGGGGFGGGAGGFGGGICGG